MTSCPKMGKTGPLNHIIPSKKDITPPSPACQRPFAESTYTFAHSKAVFDEFLQIDPYHLTICHLEALRFGKREIQAMPLLTTI